MPMRMMVAGQTTSHRIAPMTSSSRRSVIIPMTTRKMPITVLMALNPILIEFSDFALEPSFIDVTSSRLGVSLLGMIDARTM